MNLGPYQLLAQLGAGKDGVAYEARHATTGESVEVRDLSAARADRERCAEPTPVSAKRR
jgi:hypothetical protein